MNNPRISIFFYCSNFRKCEGGREMAWDKGKGNVENKKSSFNRNGLIPFTIK